MTDNICYSILKTTTQQIIQSAGFEGANNHSIDTLTDVFGRYIELLGNTVSAYANLNGRTIGTAIDVIEAMSEINIEPAKLKTWLEDEGKLLTPNWSEQSDPSRLIQGVVNGGKPNFEDRIEYRFDYGVEEYDILSLEESNSPTSPFDEMEHKEDNSLPDYVPSFFPPFPEIKEDEVMEESDKMLFQKQQELLQQRKEQEEQQQKQAIPLPVLVKNRKKPVENPFTHIIPFEDSSLAAENDDGTQQQPLSLIVNISSLRKRTEEEEEELVAKRRKLATNSLIDALTNIKPPSYKLGEGIIDKDEDLFRLQTQNAAAPGNHLFDHDIGVFDQVVRSITDPMVISKLTTPNLQTDIAVFNTPSMSTPGTPLYPNSSFHDVRSSPGPTSPESGIQRSSSMLSLLAGGGAAKKTGLKKLNKSHSHIPSSPMSLNSMSSQTLSKHSVDINAIKTGDSKYIIKKKRMLLEKQMQLERQQREEREAALGITPSSSSSSSSFSAPSNNTMNNTTLSKPTTSTAESNSNTFSETGVNTNPKNNTLSSQQPPKLNGNAPTSGPISLSSFASSSSNTPSLKMTSSSSSEKEKKKHKSKGPKLMLNFSTLPPPNVTEDVASPNTPKIRFKIKPPEQQQQQQQASNGNTTINHGIKLHASTSSAPSPKKQTSKPTTISLQQYQQQKQKSSSDNYALPIKLERPQNPTMLSSPIPRQGGHPSSNFSIAHNTGYSAEEIRCICENPTVDYGTFMIACDRCSVWYHGSCVGIAESDQVEEWYCRRCRR